MIKERFMKLKDISIVELVSENLKVIKAGKNFKLNCPFHEDKTPSLVLYPTKNTFYCFGCKKGGNIVDFISAYKNISRKDALILLKNKYKIEDVEIEGEKIDVDQELVKFQEFTEFCLYNSNDSSTLSAQKYLEDRKITVETAKHFKLGIIVNEYFNDKDFVERLNFYLKYKNLLLLKKDVSDEIISSFSDRIVFPIHNLQKEICLFGGRTYLNSEPKYLYSENNDKVSKSLFIYNLENCNSNKPLIICEGPFDVWALYQNDEKNSAAILGSDFSREQIKQLMNFNNKIYICLDSDKAGKDGVFKLLKNNIGIRKKTLVIDIPSNDPYDFYMKDLGKDIKNYSIEANEYLVNETINRMPKETQLELIKIKNEVFKIIIQSDFTVFQYGTNVLSKLINVEPQYIIDKFYDYYRHYKPKYDFILSYEKDLFLMVYEDLCYPIKKIQNRFNKTYIYKMYLKPYAKDELANLKSEKLEFTSGDNICVFTEREILKVYEMITKWGKNYEI